MNSSSSFRGEFDLVVASSATSSGSACADTCQPVIALDNAIIGPFLVFRNLLRFSLSIFRKLI